MTDIEQLKKMNKMIPELKKHGFAASSDEAVTQSGQIYKNRFVEETKEKVSQKFEDSPKEDNVGEDKLERFKNFTNQRFNQIEANISTVTAKMNEMIKIINKLEKLQDSTPVKEDPSVRQTKIKPEDKKEDGNPRSGNYNSKDVEIDKIFYFGNK